MGRAKQGGVALGRRRKAAGAAARMPGRARRPLALQSPPAAGSRWWHAAPPAAQSAAPPRSTGPVRQARMGAGKAGVPGQQGEAVCTCRQAVHQQPQHSRDCCIKQTPRPRLVGVNRAARRGQRAGQAVVRRRRRSRRGGHGQAPQRALHVVRACGRGVWGGSGVAFRMQSCAALHRRADRPTPPGALCTNLGWWGRRRAATAARRGRRPTQTRRRGGGRGGTGSRYGQE